MKQRLPIGNDSFLMIRKNQYYYIDKTLMIKEFIAYQDTVSLITRPRRFGKTLNMTMLREFFDITKDSKALFQGLAVMDTEYAGYINTKPVIFLSFKDCRGETKEELCLMLMKELLKEYIRYAEIFDGNRVETKRYYMIFRENLSKLLNQTAVLSEIRPYLDELVRVVYEYYQIPPILLIDEYDQPVLSSYEYHYHDEMKSFFSVFYGSALKGNEYLGQALLTGIQRIAKESIFSQLNNINVYTVLDKEYAPYFGLNTEETRQLLKDYDLEFNEAVKNQYDGYAFHGIEAYNPWSLLCYAKRKELASYWVNTSTNYLIQKALSDAGPSFRDKFNQLIVHQAADVVISLETSFFELMNHSTLWGLLINSGYITVSRIISADYVEVRIPNEEVKSEFQRIVAEQAHIQNEDLMEMFINLTHGDMDAFFGVYKRIVLSYTSYFDAKENAYHMLMLGMCISLRKMYKITRNIESGHGRSDMKLESLQKSRPHILIEFKQGEDLKTLKEAALNQILECRYYAGLTGRILCIGLAHDKKRCEMAYKYVEEAEQ